MTGWYNNSWNYRRSIALSPSTPVSDYQVKVVLTSTTLTGAQLTTPISGNANGNDIRFTGQDGTTLQSHWIESWSATGTTVTTTIWVKVATLGTSNIYMYYGNQTASSASNITNTMIFGDDFSTDLSKWSGNTGYFSVSNSELVNTPSATWAKINHDMTLMDTILTARIKTTDASTDLEWGIGYRIDASNRCRFDRRNNSGHERRWGDGSIYYSTIPPQWVSGEYGIDKVIIRSTVASSTHSFNGTTITGVTNLNVDMPLGVSVSSYGIGSPGTQYMDWIHVRKYAFPEPTSAIVATGGTITDIGGYRVHTFTSSGTFTPAKNMNVECLVVAGGGSGGPVIGGGGGGGGVLYDSAFPVTAQGYSIVVGNGGVCTSTTDGGNGIAGGNSSFSTLTAIGGGFGGSYGGGNGGSGGGRGRYNTTAGTGTAGQGNNGGIGLPNDNNSGGGGGKGAVGGNASGSISGSGGIGAAYSISGSSVYYGGGGGGGARAGSTAGTAPSGGGGNGGTAAGTNGTANTGGGGGGAGFSGAYIVGANGGSGIVIIRYPIGAGTIEELVPTAISMNLDKNTCAGPCSVTVTIVWQNPNATSITFRPAIIVNGTPIQYGSDVTISPSPGTTGSIDITASLSSTGTHNICPYPN